MILRNFFRLFLGLSTVSCAHKTATPANASEGGAAVIDFYSAREAYGEFSNFALYPIFLDGQWWPTSEHYYQAHKYEDPRLVEWVRTAPTPKEAAARGRDTLVEKRADWEQKKDEVMEKAVTAKFQRYPELRELLLSTGSAQIYEHTAKDCYWGDCGDRTGKNKLGLLLEKIRGELRDSRFGK